MTFNFLDLFNMFLNAIGDILTNFSLVRTQLELALTNINTFDFIGVISPYVGTIRYVCGELIFNVTIRTIQIALFIGIAKAGYQLVHMLTSSALIEKPIKIIKSFIGL